MKFYLGLSQSKCNVTVVISTKDALDHSQTRYVQSVIA